MPNNNLPFRKNTEGFFSDNKRNILARRAQDYVIFPGGGCKKEESPEDCIVRETFEETGAVVDNLKFLGTLRIVWGLDWATTEKQKERYKKYQGDEMYFFSGQIKEFKKVLQEEDSWQSQKIMQLKDVIKLLKSPQFVNNEYRQTQLRFLQKISKLT